MIRDFEEILFLISKMVLYSFASLIEVRTLRRLSLLFNIRRHIYQLGLLISQKDLLKKPTSFWGPDCSNYFLIMKLRLSS